MAKTIHFVTGNQNKLLEVQRILGAHFPYQVTQTARCRGGRLNTAHSWPR